MEQNINGLDYDEHQGILHVKKAFDDALCDDLVAHYDACHEAGFVTREGTPHRQDGQLYLANESIIRSASAMNSKCIPVFMETLWNKIFPIYFGIFPMLAEQTSCQIYNVKTQRTEVGGGFHNWHFERTDVSVLLRILTFSVFLNDVAEGGETEFLYQRKRYAAKKGDALLFPCGFHHSHRGNPPISNEKYIITGWWEWEANWRPRVAGK